MDALLSSELGRLNKINDTLMLQGAQRIDELIATNKDSRAIIHDQEMQIKELQAHNAELREALGLLFIETADYIKINNLGPVLHNRSMQLASKALSRRDMVDIADAVDALTPKYK